MGRQQAKRGMRAGMWLLLAATLLLRGCGQGGTPCFAQVVGLQPTPIGMYTWNASTQQWDMVANGTTSNPSPTTPQPFAFYGWNAGLGQWTPCTSLASCFDAGAGTVGPGIPPEIPVYCSTTGVCANPWLWDFSAQGLSLDRYGYSLTNLVEAADSVVTVAMPTPLPASANAFTIDFGDDLPSAYSYLENASFPILAATGTTVTFLDQTFHGANASTAATATATLTPINQTGSGPSFTAQGMNYAGAGAVFSNYLGGNYVLNSVMPSGAPNQMGLIELNSEGDYGQGGGYFLNVSDNGPVEDPLQTTTPVYGGVNIQVLGYGTGNSGDYSVRTYGSSGGTATADNGSQFAQATADTGGPGGNIYRYANGNGNVNSGNYGLTTTDSGAGGNDTIALNGGATGANYSLTTTAASGTGSGGNVTVSADPYHAATLNLYSSSYDNMGWGISWGTVPSRSGQGTPPAPTTLGTGDFPVITNNSSDQTVFYNAGLESAGDGWLWQEPSGGSLQTAATLTSGGALELSGLETHDNSNIGTAHSSWNFDGTGQVLIDGTYYNNGPTLAVNSTAGLCYTGTGYTFDCGSEFNTGVYIAGNGLLVNGAARVNGNVTVDGDTTSTGTLTSYAGGFGSELAAGSPAPVTGSLVCLVNGVATLCGSGATSWDGVATGAPVSYSGDVAVAQRGNVECTFDNSTTLGDYVTLSTTTAGDCHDAGSSKPATTIVGTVINLTPSGEPQQANVNLWPGSLGPLGTGTGTVTSFAAPSGAWPTWLVPTVTNATTTPSLAVAASAIPNSALANSSTTVNGQTCTLGSTCTVSGAVTSVSNSDGSLTVSPTTGAVVASLNTAHTNTWSGVQTFGSSDLVADNATLNGETTFSTLAAGSTSLSATSLYVNGPVESEGLVSGENIQDLGITGSTQCVQVTTTGLLEGTGSACGSGGSVSFSSLTGGTNNSAIMVVGSGSALTYTTGGTLNASEISGVGIGTAGDALGVLNGNNTYSGADTVSGMWTFSANGAASASPLLMTGQPYTAGTSATNTPLLYLDSGATAPTTWSGNGTLLGANSSSTFSGNLLDLKYNGTSAATISYDGRGTFNLGIITSSSANLYSPAALANVNDQTGISYAGAPGTGIRIGMMGATSSNPLSVGYNYANLIVGSSNLTTASSGTHAWLANAVINPLGTVTSGGAAVTNTASLLVQGQSTAGTNNYVIAALSNANATVFSVNNSGTVATNSVVLALGTQSISGCSYSSAVGGASAGQFTSGTTGTCTVTVTPGITAPNGFRCSAADISTGVALTQSGSTTTTCTFSGATTSGNTVIWSVDKAF